MYLQSEDQVYGFSECAEPDVELAKAGGEAVSRRSEFGSDPKKPYRSPVLTVLGSLFDFIELQGNPYEI